MMTIYIPVDALAMNENMRNLNFNAIILYVFYIRNSNKHTGNVVEFETPSDDK